MLLESARASQSRRRAYKKSPISCFLMVITKMAAFLTILLLFFVLGHIFYRGLPHLKPSLFEWKYNSSNVSMMPALINTIFTIIFTLAISLPLGIGSAIYLVEYARKDSFFVKIISITTETLAGIPSIIYGIFGMLFFVIWLEWGYSLIAGVCTLSIMVLPLVMRTTQEALIAVPNSYREGSFSLGAGKIRTIYQIVLPAGIQGILSGVILAIGRMIGESAALIYTAGTVAKIPKLGLGSLDSFFLSSTRTLSVHLYEISSEGLFINETYATAVVLCVLVLVINFGSSMMAKKIMKDGGG